jgi:septal ring factor EnvC (AmiA/AmiB activator)
MLLICSRLIYSACIRDLVMAMAERANARVDLMDTRCDGIEDNIAALKQRMLQKEKEFEDLQLEKQIENLRRELAEAKTGTIVFVFVHVTVCLHA